MGAYLVAAVTIMLRQPCVAAFSFRTNAENRRLDMKEQRERRRARVIEEARKERALKNQSSGEAPIEEV